jgi:hypothetical protein
VFLCPTNQLVGQVVREGQRCGVPTVSVTGGEALPAEGLAGQAVMVTSVQSIFQARAGRWESAEVYAMVIDDAHTAVDIVRQQYTVSIPKGNAAYRELHGLFKQALREQGMGTAQEIEEGQATAGALEVPYWVWQEHLPTVVEIVNKLARTEDAAYRNRVLGDLPGLPLHWGLIKNVSQGCRCFFSGSSVEIAPEIPPVERSKTYNGAARRIFMSATISDEAVLVREMGCDPNAAENPIQTPDAGGIGERMILVPRLMAQKAADAPGWNDIAELCKRVSKRHSVVVLTPTYDAALKWAPTGAHVVAKTDDVPLAVQELRNLTRRFVVFASRYDGLDLPDAACRLLVLDGLPVANSLMDRVDMACQGGGSVRRRAVMQRIEQGMGRAVRSSADFAVVILQGDELVPLISQHSKQKDLTEQTRKQLELGLRIAETVKTKGDWRTELEQLVNQCLDRDPAWRNAYQQHAKSAPRMVAPDAESLARATAERTAWNSYVANRGSDAAATLRTFMNSHALSEGAQAFLLQRVAWYLRREAPDDSLEAQSRARQMDHQLLMPSVGVTYKKGPSATSIAGARFAEWIDSFSHPNAVFAAIDQFSAQLVFSPAASHEQFEQALCDLGTVLGFESSRPDKQFREGPDVLWMEGQLAVPLEAKNRTKPESDEIGKHVAAQLGQAELWTQTKHAERTQVVPVSVHPRTKLNRAASFTPAARILPPIPLANLVESVRVAASGLLKSGFRTDAAAASKALTANRLSLAAIIQDRTIKPD